MGRLAALLLGLVVGALPAARAAIVGLPNFDLIQKPPEFEVWIEDPEVAPTQNVSFPLQGTEVRAVVANGVVHARVTQVYRNDGDACIQSRYIFPLPTKAAVSAMRMEIGSRTVLGEIRTREEAKKEFDEAQQNGQQASLLDQERPNVFAMSLANILPGETTKVIIEYQETLSPIDGVFAFVFPAVVGPRYVGAGGGAWAPGTDTSNLTVDVDLTVNPRARGLQSDLPMEVTHGLDSSQAVTTGMNADVVMKFWYTESAVDARLLLSERAGERYFALAVQPPQRRLLSDDQISRREYLFILDVSGSMTGYPIDLSKSLMSKLLLENVRSGDSLNILLFAGGQAVLSPSGNVDATPQSIQDALKWLQDNMYAGGGTELLPALKTAFALPRSNPAACRTVVVMTDGYVTVEKQAFDLVRDNLGNGNVFVFGIGTSVNRYIIEGLARVGYGEPFVVTNQSEGTQVADKLRHYIDTPVLTRLRLRFDEQFGAHSVEPPNLPDVFASRPVQVVGKYDGDLKGNMTLTGLLADGSEWSYTADLGAVPTAAVDAVPILWARSRIAILDDYARVSYSEADENKALVTELGLNFSLMTQHTSFIAVDSLETAPSTCKAVPVAKPQPSDGGDDLLAESDTSLGGLTASLPTGSTRGGAVGGIYAPPPGGSYGKTGDVSPGASTVTASGFRGGLAPLLLLLVLGGVSASL